MESDLANELAAVAGPRQMGTKGATRAISHITGALEAAQVPEVRLEPVPYAKTLVYVQRGVFLLAALVMLGMNLLSLLHPALSLGATGAVAVLVILVARRFCQFRYPDVGPQFEGKNIVATIAPTRGTRPAPAGEAGDTRDTTKDTSPTTPPGEILLTAHYDSISTRWGRLGRVLLSTAAIYVLAFVGLRVGGDLAYLGGTAPQLARALDVGAWIVLIPMGLTAAFLATNARENRSPGACDNASGVVVLLALARIFTALPLAHARLVFVFTGAEEYGLYGARAYLADHREHLEAIRGRFYHVNVDMVGTEVAYLGRKRGRKPFNRVLNQLIELTARAQKIDVRRFGALLGFSSDYAPFKRAGFETCSLSSKQDAKVIHTPEDTVDRVDPRKMRDAVELLKALILTLDARYLGQTEPPGAP